MVAGVNKVFVLTHHVAKDGSPKLVTNCTYPLTAKGVVGRVYTDIAVLDTGKDGFVVRETVEGISEQELRDKTDAPLIFADDRKYIGSEA